MERPEAHCCPKLHEAVELIGKRWTGAIVFVLMDGPLRFSEVKTLVPDLSDRLLDRGRGFHGVAPDARLLSVKVATADGATERVEQHVDLRPPVEQVDEGPAVDRVVEHPRRCEEGLAPELPAFGRRPALGDAAVGAG